MWTRKGITPTLLAKSAENLNQHTHLGLRRTLASPLVQVLIPRATKKPAPGTAPPSGSEADPTSGAFLTRGLLGSNRAAFDV